MAWLPPGTTRGATASPLLCATDGGSKRRPTVGAMLSSKTTRAGLTSILIIISLFLFSHRFDSLNNVGVSWRNNNTGNTTNHSPIPSPEPSIDWSQYAYIQYVTNDLYLCNSLMLFEKLHRLKSQADRVMLYPSFMLPPNIPTHPSPDAKLLLKARDEYNVKLIPIQIQEREVEDVTWAQSFTKLLVFNQTQYSRVIHLDSDSTLLSSLDELFFLPPAPVAMPNAYWLYPKKPMLSSQLMVIQPTETEFNRVMEAFRKAGPNDYDMDILDHLYRDTSLVIPHRPYDLLTSEFRRAPDMHTKYLGSETEVWDPVAALNEAKYLHFSDWPIPKPWLPLEPGVKEELEPRCYETNGVESCVDRLVWNAIYEDFHERRARVCHGDESKKKAPGGERKQKASGEGRKTKPPAEAKPWM